MYLSRETMPVITASDRMSTEASSLLEALMLLTSFSGKNLLDDQIQQLTGRDLQLIISRLLVKARQEQQWGTPNVLFAFLTLIHAVPDAAPEFVKFMRGLPVENLTASIIPLFSNQKWAAELLSFWKKQEKTPKTVKKAIIQLEKGK